MPHVAIDRLGDARSASTQGDRRVGCRTQADAERCGLDLGADTLGDAWFSDEAFSFFAGGVL
jgi:hypothetical protein